MSITVNVTSSSGLQERETSWSWAHECDASDDLLVVVVCLHDATSGDRDVSSVKYTWPISEEQALSQAYQYDNGIDYNIEIWYTTNPEITSEGQIQVTFGGTVDDFAGYAVSVSGADSSPLGTYAQQSGTNSDPLIQLSTTTGSIVVGGLMISESYVTTLNVETGDVLIAKDDLGGDCAGGSYQIATGSSTILHWDYTEDDQDWYMLAQEFLADGEAPPPSDASLLMMLGVG